MWLGFSVSRPTLELILIGALGDSNLYVKLPIQLLPNLFTYSNWGLCVNQGVLLAYN